MKDTERSHIARVNSNDPSLREITFYITDENAEGFANALIGNTTVKKLNLESDFVSKETLEFIADGLEFNTGVRDVRLSCGFDKSGIKILSRGIICNPTVRNLAIDFHRMDDEYAALVAKIIRENTSLKVLSLSRVKMRDELCESDIAFRKIIDDQFLYLPPIYVSEKGIAMITSEIKRLGTLAQFYLFDTPLSPKSAEYIAELLIENTKLEVLKLQNCGLNDNAVNALAHALAKNKKLLILDLGSNKITAWGAQKISEALQLNSSLGGLNLSQNNLGEEGLLFIVNALISNKSIRHLDVSNVKGGTGGADLMGQLLTFNDTLVSLFYTNNNGNEDGTKFIAEGLKYNHRLRFLRLAEKYISLDAVKTIAGALKKNSTLATLYCQQEEGWFPGQLQYLRSALEKNDRLVCLEGLSPSPSDNEGKGSQEIKRVEIFLARNKLNRMRILALLFKASANPDKGQAPLHVLGKDTLMMILALVYPELTPKAFQRLRHSQFFVASQVRGKERAIVPVNSTSTPGCTVM